MYLTLEATQQQHKILQPGGTLQIFSGNGKKSYTTGELQRDVIQQFPSKYQSNVTIQCPHQKEGQQYSPLPRFVS